MGLTALVLAIILLAGAVPIQDAFASNGEGPKQKHIDKHEEKHGDKHKDDKKKDKHDDKKKEKFIKKIKEKLEKHKEKIIQKIKEKIADYKEKKSKKSTHHDDSHDDSNDDSHDDSNDDSHDDSNDDSHDDSHDDFPSNSENTEESDEQISVQGEETSQIVAMNKFKGSGNDYAPTLGNDRYGNNYVDNGFTFNDFVTDVENFKTHMPLQTLQVGELNTAILKIYDNKGADKIEHVEIAFGLDSKEYASQSENTIIWTQNFKGDQSIIENDPDNLLMDVSATGEANGKIMKITFNFAFREPMDKSKIGVVVWDRDRHSRTIYFI